MKTLNSYNKWVLTINLLLQMSCLKFLLCTSKELLKVVILIFYLC